jgi:16S rRNA processing protein RimM
VTELVVARIGRPQGLRGEVSVEVRTDDPDGRFVVGAALRTDPPGAGPLTLSSVRDQSGRTILGFAGVADRTGAEQLRGVLLVVDAEDAPTVAGSAEDVDEWYDHQLVGLAVQTLDGRPLGTVKRVEHLPVQDLLVIRPARPVPDGGDVLVPFVRAIVPVVDVQGGRILLDPPGGLFEPVEGDGED